MTQIITIVLKAKNDNPPYDLEEAVRHELTLDYPWLPGLLFKHLSVVSIDAKDE